MSVMETPEARGRGFGKYNTFANLYESTNREKASLNDFKDSLKIGKINLERFNLLVLNLAEQQSLKLERLEGELGIDTLTGLPNRRFLKPKLKKQIEQLRNYENRDMIGVVVFMVDMKGLKAANLGGQSKGDRELIDFSNLLRGIVRDGDLVFRTGGDEFVIIKSVKNPAIPEKYAEIISSVVTSTQDALQAKAYVGYSFLNKNDKLEDEDITVEQLVEHLIHEADQMMVRNKAIEKGSKEEAVN